MKKGESDNGRVRAIKLLVLVPISARYSSSPLFSFLNLPLPPSTDAVRHSILLCNTDYVSVSLCINELYLHINVLHPLGHFVFLN